MSIEKTVEVVLNVEVVWSVMQLQEARALAGFMTDFAGRYENEWGGGEWGGETAALKRVRDLLTTLTQRTMATPTSETVIAVVRSVEQVDGDRIFVRSAERFGGDRQFGTYLRASTDAQPGDEMTYRIEELLGEPEPRTIFVQHRRAR